MRTVWVGLPFAEVVAELLDELDPHAASTSAQAAIAARLSSTRGFSLGILVRTFAGPFYRRAGGNEHKSDQASRRHFGGADNLRV
jgi:hypothetical protein